MKILLIHQYFKTPEEGGGIRSYYLAEGLAKWGFEVTVITAHNSPTLQKVGLAGFQVHYLPVPYDHHMPFKQRLKAFLKFVKVSIGHMKGLDHYDLAYIITTPLTTGLIGLYLKFFRRTPYVFEVGDLWPAVPQAMGIIKNAALGKCLTFLERIFYRQAKWLVGLSPAIVQHIKAIAPKQQVVEAPNMADVDFFQAESAPSNHLKQQYGLPEAFTLCYIGTMGQANDLDALLDLAEMAKQTHMPYHFIIKGDGTEKEALLQRKQAQQLDNVTFLPFGDKASVREVLHLSDAAYISFAPYELLATGSPNKFFDGLAAGKLIITNFRGWIWNLCQQHQCGIYHDRQDTLGLLMALEEIQNTPGQLEALQYNAQALAKSEFDKRIIVERLANKFYLI